MNKPNSSSWVDGFRSRLPRAVQVSERPASAAEPPRSSAAAPLTARARHVVVEVALTIAAFLGLALVLGTVAATTTGVRPLVVRSGSMEPTLGTGAMVLVQHIDATDIKVGDIVSVQRPDRTRVTHRVVALERRGPTVELTLKGDANEDPDPVPVTVTAAERMVWQVPLVGRAMAWLASGQGGFVMGCLATIFTGRVLRRLPRLSWAALASRLHPRLVPAGFRPRHASVAGDE